MWVASGFLVCCLLVLGAPSAVARYYVFEGPGGTVQWEPPTPDYVWGNLTWNAGSGGVAWNPAPTSEDNHGSAQAQDDYSRKRTVGGYTGILLNTPQATDEFTSDPVPRDLHLNNSRALQLDLAIKNAADGTKACNNGQTPSGILVNVFLGERRLAGSQGGTHFTTLWGVPLQSHPVFVPAAPSGYTICMYRMGTEIDLIPAGQSIRITIEYPNPPYPIQLGLAGDHRSQIRIATYSEFELFYRLPDLAGTDPSGLAGGEPAATMGASVAGFAGAAGSALAGRRRRARPALCAAALLLVALSGCLAGGPKDASSTTVGGAGEIQQTISGEGVGHTGKIVGLVHDDLHIPVGGAHVSLLGSAVFGATDGRGAFVLSDVPPGSYRMRVDAKGFRSLEDPVNVEAGRITRVDVLLLPLSVAESDFRPHHHDYWKNAERIMVMDKDLGTVCTDVYGCNPASSFRLPGSSADKTNLVLPGAYLVEVVLSWDEAQMGRQNFGLKVEHNAYAFDGYNYNTSIFYPRGKEQVFRIPANWEMADVGHQLFSTWEFRLYGAFGEAPKTTSADYAQYAASAYSAGYAIPIGKYLQTSAPTFHAKVFITRGVIPLEPPHPDHWTGQSSLQAAKSESGYHDGTLIVGLSDAFGPGCWRSRDGVGANWFFVPFGAPGKLIPPGTKWLEIKLTSNRDPTPHFDWILSYKTARTPPISYYSPGYTTQDFQAAEAHTKGATEWTWKLPVTEDGVDNMYAKRTSWYFAAEASDPDAACTDAHAHTAASPSSIVQEAQHLTLVVKAHQDPMP